MRKLAIIVISLLLGSCLEAKKAEAGKEKDPNAQFRKEAASNARKVSGLFWSVA